MKTLLSTCREFHPHAAVLSPQHFLTLLAGTNSHMEGFFPYNFISRLQEVLSKGCRNGCYSHVFIFCGDPHHQRQPHDCSKPIICSEKSTVTLLGNLIFPRTTILDHGLPRLHLLLPCFSTLSSSVFHTRHWVNTLCQQLQFG